MGSVSPSKALSNLDEIGEIGGLNLMGLVRLKTLGAVGNALDRGYQDPIRVLVLLLSYHVSHSSLGVKNDAFPPMSTIERHRRNRTDGHALFHRRLGK